MLGVEGPSRTSPADGRSRRRQGEAATAAGTGSDEARPLPERGQRVGTGRAKAGPLDRGGTAPRATAVWASLDPWLKPARPDVSARRLPVPGPPPRRPILDAILAFPLRSHLWLGAGRLGPRPAVEVQEAVGWRFGASSAAVPAARLAVRPPSPVAGGMQGAHGTRRGSWCRTASQ